MCVAGYVIAVCACIVALSVDCNYSLRVSTSWTSEWTKLKGGTCLQYSAMLLEQHVYLFCYSNDTHLLVWKAVIHYRSETRVFKLCTMIPRKHTIVISSLQTTQISGFCVTDDDSMSMLCYMCECQNTIYTTLLLYNLLQLLVMVMLYCQCRNISSWSTPISS